MINFDRRELIAREGKNKKRQRHCWKLLAAELEVLTVVTTSLGTDVGFWLGD